MTKKNKIINVKKIKNKTKILLSRLDICDIWRGLVDMRQLPISHWIPGCGDDAPSTKSPSDQDARREAANKDASLCALLARARVTAARPRPSRSCSSWTSTMLDNVRNGWVQYSEKMPSLLVTSSAFPFSRVSARYFFLISILILGHFDTYPYYVCENILIFRQNDWKGKN